MPTRVSKSSITRARRLRRDMTGGERKLWSELKQFRGWYGVHVRKQVPIGPFVTDFAIQSHRLVIEVDGEHHFTPEGQARDAARDAWLERAGYRIIRINTGELEHSFDGCVEEILGALGLMHDEPHDLKFSPPPRTPPLKGEGESEPQQAAPESSNASVSPSPLRGGVRGGGNVPHSAQGSK